MYERTVILEKYYLQKEQDLDRKPALPQEDATSTRVIGRQSLTCNGVAFEWWAVGDAPALVTVRSPLFGSRAEFCDGEVQTFAQKLAEQVLATHYERAASARSSDPKRATGPSEAPNLRAALTKPGWFKR